MVRVFLSMLLVAVFAPLSGCSQAADELPSAGATEILTLGATDDPVLGFSSVNDLAVGEHLHVLQGRVRLDALGSPELRMGLPAGFRAYAATGTEVWGVVRGEYGEYYIRGYRVG